MDSNFKNIKQRQALLSSRLLSVEEQEAIRIGKLIRRIRKAQHWNQQELCDRANRIPGGESLYRQLISLFEKGKRLPTLPQIKALASALEQDYKTWV